VYPLPFGSPIAARREKGLSTKLNTVNFILLEKLQTTLAKLQLNGDLTLTAFSAKIGEICNAHIQIATAPLPGGYSGFCLHDGQRNYRICCNNQTDAHLLELTILHELYHILLGHVEAKPPATLADVLHQLQLQDEADDSQREPVIGAVMCRNANGNESGVTPEPQEVEVELLACLTQPHLVANESTPVGEAMQSWLRLITE
jgi:hypothetical protein